MREVIVYSRRGCHLCEQLIDEVEPRLRGRASLIVRDIDADPAWVEAYGLDIPVLCVDGQEVCRHRLDLAALNAALATGI